MGLTHVQWVIRKIPLDKASHQCGTSKQQKKQQEEEEEDEEDDG